MFVFIAFFFYVKSTVLNSFDIYIGRSNGPGGTGGGGGGGDVCITS